MNAVEDNPNSPEERPGVTPEELASSFTEFQPRLERMIEFRLDPRIRNRIDPGDILQDSFMEAQRRLSDFNSNLATSLYVWVRQLTIQILIDVHRANFRQKRNVGQEIRLDRAGGNQNATSLLMANELVGQISTPSKQMSREEDLEKLRIALDTMEKIDQEVLALRHFEQLGNNDVAEILGIGVTAASNRYVRAMSRLAEIVNQLQAEK